MKKNNKGACKDNSRYRKLTKQKKTSDPNVIAVNGKW